MSCTSAEGDSSNTFPFVTATPRRYMQIHADLGAGPLVITKLTFRVGASTLVFPGTRTHDMELYMGEALPTAVALPSLKPVLDWLRRHHRAVQVVSGLFIMAIGVLIFTDAFDGMTVLVPTPW